MKKCLILVLSSLALLAISCDESASTTPSEKSCEELGTCEKSCEELGTCEKSCKELGTCDALEHIRFMTANTTSGKTESYDPDPGRAIFKVVKPDIVMIQEFKYFSGTYDEFVAETFGEEYEYFRGTVNENYNLSETSKKPNGIITRYPFVRDADGNPLVGEWDPVYEKTKNGETYEVDAYTDRKWTWGVVDIPGDRDLLVVSVHLHTDNHAKEFSPLAKRIAVKQAEGNYHVIIGGDFNTKEGVYGRDAVLGNADMASVFDLDKATNEWPCDQNGDDTTNKNRGYPLDWILMSHDLESYAVSTEIGLHTGDNAYPYGHVFDTRVYDKVGELYYILPQDGSYQLQKNDSASMQHMAVIRDVEIPFVYETETDSGDSSNTDNDDSANADNA